MRTSTPSSEPTPCPLCESTGGVPVGQQVRDGHSLTHVSCHQCGCVYITDPWDADRLSAAYAAEFAEPTQLALPIDEGALLADDPQYGEVLDTWLKGRATHAASLASIQPGDRVLEIGAGRGETLEYQRKMLRIQPLAVETLESRATVMRAAGIETTVCPLTNPEWSFEHLDIVQVFHHLQRVPEPLALLRRAWESLAVGGRIVVEVPNLYHPHGRLEETFFRATNLCAFSESTLAALLRRAGFSVERTVSSLTLFMVGRKDTPERPVRAFSTNLLAYPEHTAEWVSQRLHNYAAMDKTRRLILEAGPSMDAVHQLVHELMKPAFAWHLVDVVVGLVEFFMGYKAVGLACLVATAASEGPYEPELTERFLRLAQVIRREGMAAVRLSEPTVEVDNSKALVLETRRQNVDAKRPLRQDSNFAALVDELRQRAVPDSLMRSMTTVTGFSAAPVAVAQA
jgi:SAM-dependent methyltransferase